MLFSQNKFQSAFYFLPWEHVPKGEFCKNYTIMHCQHNQRLAHYIYLILKSQSIKDEDLLQFMVHSSENETIQRKFCIDLDRIIYDFYSFVFFYILVSDDALICI